MNILLMNRTFVYPFTGGVANSLNYISKQLVRAGHKVVILCEKSEDGLQDVELIDGVKIIRHPKFFRFFHMREDVNYLHQLKKTLVNVFKEENINVAWSRHLNYTYAALKAQLPVVYYLPSFFAIETLEFAKGSKSPMKKAYFYLQSVPQYFMERFVTNKCKAISVLSKNRKAELLARYSIDPEKVHIVQPGVDAGAFNRGANKNSAREQVQLPVGKKILLTVCRQEYRKNLDGLLREFSILQQKRDDAVLVLVGTGSQHTYLKEYAKSIGLNGSVIFKGFQENTWPYYKAADIFLWPSLQEGFGQVLLEALSCGSPCIGYAQGDPIPNVPNEEIIEDGTTGLIADYFTQGDMARKVEMLLDDDQLRDRMSINAVDAARSRFSWSETTSRMFDLSGKVIDGSC